MPLQVKTDIHVARRLWHFFGVLTIAGLDWLLGPREALIACLVGGGFMIGTDIARQFWPPLNRLFYWIFKPFLRESERKHLAGSTFMMAGVTIVVTFFPKPVSMLSLLFLATADPLASYFGIRYGTDKLVGNKSLEGSLAAFTACFFVSLGFYWTLDIMVDRLSIVCLLSGLIGAVSELLPIGKLDDNFVFPVVSATLLLGLFHVFGGL